MDKSLLAQWREDEKAFFEGWDFSYIKDRFKEDDPPWDYRMLAKEMVRKASYVLDVDTGGGEVFSSFAPFPPETYAVEGYRPNFGVAQKRLCPLGVKVVESDSSRLPFSDDSFDLILNRHGGLNVGETYRVLKKEGRFISQQVGGDNWDDLVAAFDRKDRWPENVLPIVRKKMEAVGFTIEMAKEWRGKVTFKDVGSIVYLLKATPWAVDGFSVDTYLNYLERLQSIIEKKGRLEFNRSLFLVQAKKL